MKSRILLLVLSLCPAFSHAAPDAETLKAAEQMAQTIGLEKQMANGFNAMIPSIEGLAKRLNLGEKETDELKEIYRVWFMEDIDRTQLHKQVIEIYAELYTKDELAELTKFYQSPLGQKTLTTMPEIMRKSSLAGMQAAQAKQSLLQERLKPFMEKHGQKFQAPGQPGATGQPAAPEQPAAPAPAPAPAGK